MRLPHRGLVLALLTACGCPSDGNEVATDTAGDTAGSTESPPTSDPETSGQPTTTATSATGSATATTFGDPTTTATTGDTMIPDAGPTQDLVPVEHRRELRGVWLASVSNINFPSANNLGAAQQQAELEGMFDLIAGAGLNAVFLQVRPESDALYASTVEPWSRYLTGTQGSDPGYDPLAFAITAAHARGLELHAWLNPYRAKANKNSVAADNHISKLFPQHAHEYANTLWMDPGAVPVQDQLIDVISDIAQRYDVDGIHFDDYFYPYPNGDEFPDNATYNAYVQSGGMMDRGDWRRDNVNRIVTRINDTIAAINPDIRWGISPFGIYRPGIPPGIQGLDQYAEIYADPLKWMQEGWLDYLAPQLYWPSTQAPQAYGTLIEWWTSITTGGRYIFAGNYLSQLGSEPKWPLEEFEIQVGLGRELHDEGSQGNIFFHIGPLQTNKLGVTDLFTNVLYATPALTPPIAELAGTFIAPPWVSVRGTTVSISHDAPASLRAWVAYHSPDEQTFTLTHILPADHDQVELTPGTWAISAVARNGCESLGVRIDID